MSNRPQSRVKRVVDRSVKVERKEINDDKKKGILKSILESLIKKQK